MAQVRFRATHNFQGDAAHHQLSFSAGNIISVDAKNAKGGEGWVYGTLFGSTRSGWCPQSYLVLQQSNPAPAASSPAPTGFSDMKVSMLRKLCASRGIDTSAMLEKREFVQALTQTEKETPPQKKTPSTHHQPRQEPAPPANTQAPPPPPAYVYDDDDDESINDGFSGPILGGAAGDGQGFQESIHTKDLDTPNNPFA